MGDATMPDWESLWAREPALRPENWAIVLDCVGDERERRSISAPLCRDAAVRWLLRHGWSLAGEDHFPVPDGEPIFYPSARFPCREGDAIMAFNTGDIDRMLFVACVRTLVVLGTLEPDAGSQILRALGPRQSMLNTHGQSAPPSV